MKVIRSAINYFFTFLLLVILIYPSSTILFPPNSINPNLFYIFVVLLITFNTWRYKSETFSGPHYQLLVIFIIICELFLLFKYLTDQESYILKNITIGFLSLMIVSREKKYIQKMIFQLLLVLSIIVVFSNLVLLIYLLDESTNPIEFSAINLKYLNNLNPAITRTDFTYILPWYLTTIPVGLIEDFFLGLAYQRYTNIFSEWTYLWYFVCPALIILTQIKSIFNLLLIVQIIGILVLGLSVWGLGSLILSLLISYALKVINLDKLLIMILILSVLFSFLILFDADIIKILLDKIGSYRYEQVLYYLEGIWSHEVTLFGNVTNQHSESIIWGASYVLWQYGITGFVLFILFQIYAVYIALKILCRPNFFSNQDRSLSTVLIFLVLMGLKIPLFFSFLQIFIMSVLSRNLDLNK